MNQTPGISISRMQLTMLLLGIPLLGITIVSILTLLAPARPEAKLDAELKIDFVMWSPPGNNTQAARLMPSVVLKNNTDQIWKHVTLALDKQFYYNHHLPMGPGEVLEAPLETFITKGGNITFRPSTQSVQKVVAFAQIPSGERAVLEKALSYDPQSVAKP